MLYSGEQRPNVIAFPAVLPINAFGEQGLSGYGLIKLSSVQGLLMDVPEKWNRGFFLDPSHPIVLSHGKKEVIVIEMDPETRYIVFALVDGNNILCCQALELFSRITFKIVFDNNRFSIAHGNNVIESIDDEGHQVKKRKLNNG